MSASLASAVLSEKAPIRRASRLLPLLAAVLVFPFDTVLAGMVRVGLGAEAICLFLGLRRDTLSDALARLGLPTPHTRPPRKAGPKGWSILDTMRLIVWRLGGVHPETIGTRLDRSVGAVRSKCRRLGLKAPPRKQLHRPDPSALVDPRPDFAYQPAFGYQAPAPPSSDANARSTVGKCGTVAGPVRTRSLPGSPGVAASAPPAAEPLGAFDDTPHSQHDLELFQVIPASDRLAPPPPVVPAQSIARAPCVAPVGPAVGPAPAATDPDPVVRAAGDLSWIGRLRNIEANQEAILLLSVRYFGGQHWKYITQAAGDTLGRIKTALTRAWLPRDHDRSKFYATYSPHQARETLERSPYELARDAISKKYFWRDRTKRGVDRTSRETQRAKGMIGEYDRYKSRRITLAPRHRPHLGGLSSHAPFASRSATMGGS